MVTLQMQYGKDIEPYREYRGEVQLANSTHAHAIGGNIVAADEWNQGTQGVAASYDEYELPESEIVTERLQPEIVTERLQPRFDSLPQRTIDDLVDPYNSPMLDGFLQADFEPEPVVSKFIKGQPVYAEIVG